MKFLLFPGFYGEWDRCLGQVMCELACLKTKPAL
jgi:hypothetical protein